MTRFDAIRRQLSDIEKHHERALAKHEMQVNLLCGYRDELEDRLDIATEMLAKSDGCSKDWAATQVDEVYEARQLARTAAEESVGSEYLAGDALANAALAHIVSEYGLKQPQEDAS